MGIECTSEEINKSTQQITGYERRERERERHD